jgi:hypothetical protein
VASLDDHNAPQNEHHRSEDSHHFHRLGAGAAGLGPEGSGAGNCANISSGIHTADLSLLPQLHR